MKNFFTAGLMICVIIVSAQTPQQDINNQVWKPFTQALLNRDAAAFIGLHSKDVIRVERNGNRIINFFEYKKDMEASWPVRKESAAKDQIKRTFELRFTERVSNGELAYEVGYFKNESINPAGEKRSSYGNFHVTLRKENGTWKILVDSDSNLGGAITEEMFQAASPVE